MPYSPLDDLYAQLGYSPPGAQSIMPGASPLRPFSPAEEESTLKTLGQKVLPGIVWAGQALDKTMGARAIRGLISGNPRELLSILPLSDTFNFTDPSEAVHGADLLRQAGAIHGENDDWQNVLAGIATEIGLNPVTYLTLGGSALTEAGQAAKAMNILPKTLAQRIGGFAAGTPEAASLAARLGRPVAGEALGGWAGFGVPFKYPSTVLGTGPTAQKAAQLLGRGIEGAKYSMLGRSVGSLFDPTVRGTTAASFQQAMRGPYAAELDKTVPFFRKEVARLAQQADSSPVLSSMTPLELRTAFEVPGPYSPEIMSFVDEANLLKNQAFNEFKAAGGDVGTWESIYGTQHFPALNPTQLAREYGSGVGRSVPVRSGSLLGREPLYDLPGGRATSEAIMADPAAATLTKPDIFTRHLGGDIGRMTNLEHLRNVHPEIFDPASIWYTRAYAEDLARLQDMWGKAGLWAKRLPTMAAERLGPTGTGMFKGVHPLTDLADYLEGMATGTAGARTVGNVLKDTMELGGSGVPIPSAIKAASGMNQAQLEADVMATLFGRGTPVSSADLAGVTVPKDVYSDILSRYSAGTAADSVSAPLRALDSITSLWKRLTLMAPAYFGKKAISGLFRPLAEGASPGELAAAEPIIASLRAGQVVPGLATMAPKLGATDAEATAELGRLAFAHRMFGRSQSGLPELATPGGEPLGDIVKQIPGMRAEPNLGEITGSFFKGRTDPTGASLDPLGVRLNPLNMRGVGGVGGMGLRNTDQFAPAVAARQFGEMVDDYTRGATAVGRLLAGEDPAAAAAFTRGTQFVGSDLSPFESAVMRRVFPFYSYLRHKLPFVAHNVAENPGGLQAMGIRAASDLTETGKESVPSGLGGGLAIPVGDLGEEGKQAYLTRLGLPFDEAAAFLGSGPDAAQHSVSKLMGHMNPLLKIPVELASGMHFGAEGLSDRHGPEPSIIQQLVMNLPVQRQAIIAQQLASVLGGEKGPAATAVNLLTGGKVAEVNPAQEKVSMEKELVDRLLGHSPDLRKFEQYYVRPEDLPTLTPTEVAAIRLQRTIESRAQAAVRARR